MLSWRCFGPGHVEERGRALLAFGAMRTGHDVTLMDCPLSGVAQQIQLAVCTLLKCSPNSRQSGGRLLQGNQNAQHFLFTAVPHCALLSVRGKVGIGQGRSRCE